MIETTVKKNNVNLIEKIKNFKDTIAKLKGFVWLGLWHINHCLHINHCRLFNAKSSLYIFIKYI